MQLFDIGVSKFFQNKLTQNFCQFEKEKNFKQVKFYMKQREKSFLFQGRRNDLKSGEAKAEIG